MGKEGKGRGKGKKGEEGKGRGNICRTNVKLLPAPLVSNSKVLSR